MKHCSNMKVVILVVLILNTVTKESSSMKQRNGKLPQESAMSNFLAGKYERLSSEMCYSETSAEWEHLVDIDDAEKANASLQATLEAAKFQKYYWRKYFHNYKQMHFKDAKLKRQASLLSVLGSSALSDEKLVKLTNISDAMTTIYSGAKICPYEKQYCVLEHDGLTLDPDIIDLMATSQDYNKLLYLWAAWRNATGAKMKDLYFDYVQLSNEAARANNFSDKGAMWRHEFESLNFEEKMQQLWEQIKPLYDELHQYVLNKLKLKFPQHISEDETYIPAHVLGNMWAQNWIDIASFVLPFPDDTINYNDLLKFNHFTVLKMFDTANDFYLSLGLESNAMCYDVNSGAMIEKPQDKKVLCHASAWDFCNGKDFRIKMCTEVNFEDFVIIHHEMGHIEYYQLYKDQPHTFRTGANPGFHEAVGDTIALSVSTPQHLYQIGLLEDFHDSNTSSLNALMNMALSKIAFLPFGYILDKWRWDVFSKKIPSDQWNCVWWKYRKKYQKIKPPISRSDEDDFDPGAKFHVPGDSQYISYFFAHILQFQLHRALCIVAEQYVPGDKEKPLHKCDIYESKAAGDKLRSGLSLGASVHWRVVLEEMTGEKELSGSAILEYFSPLYEFLKYENDKYASMQK